jgi:5-deoxy-glucuronate isomerase
MAHDSHPGQGGDLVAIFQGHGPVAAAPGYEPYYLWVLAGEERAGHPYEDPNHAWVAARAE